MTFPEVLVLERSVDEGVYENGNLEKMEADADAGVGTEATPEDDVAQAKKMPQGQGWLLIDLLFDFLVHLFNYWLIYWLFWGLICVNQWIKWLTG